MYYHGKKNTRQFAIHWVILTETNMLLYAQMKSKAEGMIDESTILKNLVDTREETSNLPISRPNATENKIGQDKALSMHIYQNFHTL